MTDIGQDLLNVPFPQMVQALGMSIADAQYALDKVSVRIAQLLAGYEVDDKGNVKKNEASFIQLQEKGERYSLLALGFSPTFYQFSETYIELKMAITMKEESEKKASMSTSIRAPFGLFSASVSASYSQKYQYSADGSSYFRTKLVTLPAPAVFEQRLRELTKTETGIGTEIETET
jgi:hypothetical protein